MNLSLFIARRYLFSRKQKSVINVISWISLVGIAVSSMALVVVLSVYNGIGTLTQGLFNVFDPELKIEPATGKSFHTADIDYDALCAIEGVVAVSPLVEENAWLTFRQRDAIVTLRGVDSMYGRLTGIDTMLYFGQYRLSDIQTFTDPETGEQQATHADCVVLGGEIYRSVGLHPDANGMVGVHIPRRGKSLGSSFDQAFNSGYALPSGAFYIQQEIDSRYALPDIAFVRRLLDYATDQCTALSLSLDGSRPMADVKSDARRLLGPQYQVRDRFEQQPLYYKIFRSERLGVILILALIVLITTLNLVASLSLLIIDKRRDVYTMRSMGMPVATIRRAFFAEGLLISFVGIVAGVVMGFVVCFVQQQFGIVTMGDNFVVSAFPVEMRLADFLLTIALTAAISSVAVFFTTRRAKF